MKPDPAGFHGQTGVTLCALAVLVLVSSALAPGTARAEPPPAPVQLGFVNPLQMIDEHRSITVFRLSLLHVANRDVQGLDLSLGATRTDGMLRGLQIAGINDVNGDCSGVQVGVFANYCGGHLSGAQLSLAAYAHHGKGVQIAPVMARADELEGLQIGLITYAKQMKGLQLGLLNFNEHGFLPVFPIFNFGR